MRISSLALVLGSVTAFAPTASQGLFRRAHQLNERFDHKGASKRNDCRHLVAMHSAGQGTRELKGRVHEWGEACQSSAQASKENMASSSTSLALKPFYLVKYAAFFGLFVLYRAYRGFFVLVPAVFQEVQDKLRDGRIEAQNELNADVNPETGKLYARSALLISIGAGLVRVQSAIATALRALLRKKGRNDPRGDPAWVVSSLLIH